MNVSHRITLVPSSKVYSGWRLDEIQDQLRLTAKVAPKNAFVKAAGDTLQVEWTSDEEASEKEISDASHPA